MSGLLTPQQLASSIGLLGDDVLRQLPHSLLYSARQYVKPADQDRLAGVEHRAFAREATKENPWMSLPIAAAIPAYQAYKAVMPGSRSRGSLGQAAQGFRGIWEGL